MAKAPPFKKKAAKKGAKKKDEKKYVPFWLKKKGAKK